MAYQVKRAGRGNWKITTITVVSSCPLSIGSHITIGRTRYRVVGIVGE